MPAKDHYHNAVVRALAKDGWIITTEQFFVKFYRRHLWIDVHAEQEQRRIFVEIKGFENLISPIEYLETVLGQYILYLAVLENLGFQIPLYLAVPIFAYEGFLSERIGQVGIQKIAAKLLVFDPEVETIVQWII